MESSRLSVNYLQLGRERGSSPSQDLYYVMVLFDISDQKKYRLLIKILQRYSSRIQKSVFEARLNLAQIKELLDSVGRLMESERFYDASDNIRIYKIAGNCEMTVFGECQDTEIEENVFI